MAGRRRKRENVHSFRTFLKTGDLGPLQPDMSMMDVARLFGPPVSWYDEVGIVMPCYWCYGHLEISFAHHAPHEIDFFQLEWASLLKGEGRFLGEAMRLKLDGIDVDMPVSDMLRQRLWPLGAVRVAIDVGLGTLEIVHGAIAMMYAIYAAPDDPDDLAETVLIPAFDRGDMAAVAAWCEKYARIDSIYSTPARQQSTVCCSPRRYGCDMSGRDYLDLLKPPRRRAPAP